MLLEDISKQKMIVDLEQKINDEIKSQLMKIKKSII
jgi:hypothetical protein